MHWNELEAPLIERKRKELGRMLRAFRDLKGYTQEETAHSLAIAAEGRFGVQLLVPSEYIGDLEAGKVKKVSLDLILCLSEALGVDGKGTAMLLDAGGHNGTGWWLISRAGNPAVVRECVENLVSGRQPITVKDLTEQLEVWDTKATTYLREAIKQLQLALEAMEQERSP
ncbi:MAG: hypothetical protein OJF49_000295 [Ktedonobacterales bacterium]|nr:MAG: hypothetical protein OJF49_000295 [Ktedonobacterales bacterium]